MNRTLPIQPNLTQLKHQAKDLVKAHDHGDAAVCDTLRLLRRFAQSTDQKILSAECTLSQAQFALALSYGFPSWNALKEHVAARRRATTVTRVDREPEQVVIRGLENIDWGGPPHRRSNSIIESFAAALRCAGEDMPYETLMGLSGAAFRIQLAEPDWCPSAHCAVPGFDCFKTAIAATGYSVAWYPIEHTERPDPDGAWRAVKASIDAGIPGLFSERECSLIVGYRKDKQAYLLRDYFKWYESGYSEPEQSPWEIFVVDGKTSSPNRRESVIQSLRLAVELAHTEYHPGFRENARYLCGFAAFEAWIDRLRHAFRDTDEHPFPLLVANGHGYATLVNSRAAAAEYLRNVADGFSADVAAHLVSAARLYDRMQRALDAAHDCAPLPWLITEDDPWTQEKRNTQADMLEQALAQERQAVSEIDAALATLDATAPEV